MNKRLAQSVVVFFLSVFIASSVSYAQETPSTKIDTSTTSQLEITFPMQKDDFLLFYGVTKDVDVNTKVDSLRKDFMDKFQALKDEYKKSMNDALGDTLLTSPVQLDTKDSTKVTAQIKKTDAKSLVKKYTIKTDKASSTDVIISPIVNTIDASSGIRTESSTWFKKVKAIFNW